MRRKERREAVGVMGELLRCEIVGWGRWGCHYRSAGTAVSGEWVSGEKGQSLDAKGAKLAKFREGRRGLERGGRVGFAVGAAAECLGKGLD